MTIPRIPRLLAAAALAVAASAPASAAVITYTSNLQTVNSRAQVDAGNGSAAMPGSFVGSTASGTSTLTLDTDSRTLRLQINATGLEAGVPHIAHIHGRNVDNTTPGSGALDSTLPTLAQDTDGDGFIEVLEGAATYGPILLDLMVIGDTAEVNYDMTFDLDGGDAPFAPVDRFNPDGPKFGLTDVLGDDLVSLALRHIVIHGLTVPFGMGNAPGEVDGTTTFLPGEGDNGDPFEGTVALPVAQGVIVEQVPEPAALGILGLGVLGLGLARRRRKV